MESIHSWLVLLAIILINSVFVIAEISIITSRKARLENNNKRGDRGAKHALDLVNDPEGFLSTVQVGITLLNILLGIYGGATVTADLEHFFAEIKIFSPYKTIMSQTTIILFITYLTVMGEIVPKRLAMLYPEKIASIIAPSMKFFSKLFFPLVYCLTISAKIILKMLGIKNSSNNITIEDLKIILKQAEMDGVVNESETSIMKRLMNLGTMQVGAIMIPRKEVVSLDINDSPEKYLQILQKHSFNYYPVIDKDINNIVGIICIKNFVTEIAKNQSLDIKNIIEKVTYTPDISTIYKLLDLLKIKQSRVAVVIDEYGDVEGMITLNDVLKSFVGDMATLIEDQHPKIKKHNDNSFIIAGNASIEDVVELLDISLPQNHEYRTLASLILCKLQDFPKVGSEMVYQEWSFKVIKINNFRIEKILVKKTNEIKSK